MTLPNGAAGLATIGLEFAFTNDGSIPGAVDRTRGNIEDVLKGDVQSSEGWLGAHLVAFDGLPAGIPLFLGMAMRIAQEITGFPIVEWGTPVIGMINDVFNLLGSFSARLSSMFSSVNFLLEGAWDAAEAIGHWLFNDVLPLGFIAELIDGLIPDFQIPNFDASKIVSGQFAMEMIEGLLDFLDNVPLLGDIVQAVTGFVGGLGDLADWAGDLLKNFSPLNALNLFNSIPSALIGLVGFSQIGNTQPNLLTNGGFVDAISVAGGGIWIYDPTDGRVTLGCVAVTAAGAVRRLQSNAIPVAQGDKISHVIRAKWSGLTYTGTPIRTRMVRFLNGVEVGIDNLVAPVAPATNQTGWTDLAGSSYVVPAGCDHVCYELYISDTATAGTVKFDDGEFRKTGLFKIPWTEDLPDSLQDLVSGAQGIIDSIFEGITGFPIIGGLLNDIINAFRNIPFLNVSGPGGPPNIGAALQSTWDQWISGLVGEVGTGAELSDLFNIGQLISSWSNLGRQAWDVLGIRNNKPMATGMMPTSSSNISLDKIAFTTAAQPGASSGGIAITQSTARRVYKRVEDYSPIGVVSWTGYGTTDITHFFVNIFKLNEATGDEDLVHASANIIGDVGSTLATNIYEVPTPMETIPGEVYSYELSLRGTGTHRVAGDVSWLPARNDMFPRKWAAVRNSGTSAPPSTLAIGGVTYAGETPLIEVGITTSGVDIPRTPEPRYFNTPVSSTIPIPNWCNYVDVIVLGAGGGGHQGGTWGIGGQGGSAGTWAVDTWERGTDFTGTVSISFTVGAGGSGGSGNGGDGGASTASITGHSVSGAGGNGSDFFDPGGFDFYGRSPGNIAHEGVSYVGGGQTRTYGARGAAPGSGGAGGNWVSFQGGGAGGAGGVWFRFRQS